MRLLGYTSVCRISCTNEPLWTGAVFFQFGEYGTSVKFREVCLTKLLGMGLHLISKFSCLTYVCLCIIVCMATYLFECEYTFKIKNFLSLCCIILD